MTRFRTFSAAKILSGQESDGGISRFNPTPHIPTPSFRLLSLEPSARTPRHNHTETELWTVLRGTVEVDIEGTKTVLDEASIINLAPLQRHDIRPMGGPAVLQVCFWHDQPQFEEAVDQYGATDENSSDVHVLIPNWVTPNGRLHLGHASGPYIHADILRRALELNGQRSIYVAGTLGHLEHIAVAASAEGLGYYELADRNTASIRESFLRLQVVPDVFLGPRPTERFTQIVHEIFDALRQAGAIEERELPVPFDERSGRYVVDAHLVGLCPNCGAQAFGHECEGCGSSVLDSDLRSPTDRAGNPLTHRPLKRIFLDLGKLKGCLETFRDSAVLPAQAKSFIDSWLARQLPAICVTNPISQGISVPLDGYDDQRFTVFMEHAARHFLAIEEWALDAGKPSTWQELNRQGELELSLFFGSDNSFGRLIITPTVTLAVGAHSLAPKRCYFNHFLLLDGSKFSTGRNHAIWVNEFVNQHNADMVRFFLTLVRPGVEETNFTLAAFNEHVAGFWRGELAGLVEAVRLQMEAIPDSAIAPVGTWGRDEIRFYRRIREMDELISYWYRPDTFDPALIARQLQVFVGDMRRFIDGCKLWPRGTNANPDSRRTQLRLMVSAAARISLALYPLAPKAGGMLAEAIGNGRPSLAWLQADWLMGKVRPLAGEKLKALGTYLQQPQ